MTADPAAPPGPAFARDRPSFRSVPPWHPLAYISTELPRRLEQLAPELSCPRDGRVLDYGCGDLPYRRFFAPGIEYVGADLPGNPDATVEINPDGTVPIDDESVDAILSTQVLEHVDDPGLYLRECHRMLRPRGTLLLSTHGFMPYHPDPDDFWRWTCAGLRRAVESERFEVMRLEGIMGLAASGLQLFQDALYARLTPPLAKPLALMFQTLIRAADRLEPRRSRDLNALVFALVARKR